MNRTRNIVTKRTHMSIPHAPRAGYRRRGILLAIIELICDFGWRSTLTRRRSNVNIEDLSFEVLVFDTISNMDEEMSYWVNNRDSEQEGEGRRGHVTCDL